MKTIIVTGSGSLTLMGTTPDLGGNADSPARKLKLSGRMKTVPLAGKGDPPGGPGGPPGPWLAVVRRGSREVFELRFDASFSEAEVIDLVTRDLQRRNVPLRTQWRVALARQLSQFTVIRRREDET